MIVRDQLSRTLTVHQPLSRIISLVPSLTELLFDLGLDSEIVGITTFCVHPAAKTNDKPRVGGTKKLNIPAIRQLRPQLIIANKEENQKDQIDLLAQEYQVWVSNVGTLDHALDLITSLGQIVGHPDTALTLRQNITRLFADLIRSDQAVRVLYLIWRKPYMAAGSGTFINSMMECAGFANCIASSRYPELSGEAISRLDPEIIFLSSEPFPFSRRHISELQAICPQAKVCLVDGQMFSWYGSRLRLAPEYFKQLLQTLR